MFMYIYIHMHVYIYTYICTYVCKYIYIHIYQISQEAPAKRQEAQGVVGLRLCHEQDRVVAEPRVGAQEHEEVPGLQ